MRSWRPFALGTSIAVAVACGATVRASPAPSNVTNTPAASASAPQACVARPDPPSFIDPKSISDTIAVCEPARGAPVGRQFAVRGLSRTFEATTSWRVRDRAQRVVVNGFATASVGSGQQWGNFEFEVQLPSTVSGDIALELYWTSPRDGSDQGLVIVPLTVR